MSTELITRLRVLAYFLWRKMPPGNDLCDIEQEAIMGALGVPEGLAMIAAKRAVIDYLRRQYPGSRTGNPFRFTQTVPEFASDATQDSDIDLGLARRAVDQLPLAQLRLIQLVFLEEMQLKDAAAQVGMTEAKAGRTKQKALQALAVAMGATA